jgi:putative transposase
MPRVRRSTQPGFIYHVFNRAVRNTKLFESAEDYRDFLRLILRAKQRTPIRIPAYSLMPNHWHFLIWPYHEGDLSNFMKWVCTTHALRWNKSHGVLGRGAVYQGRFKSVPVEQEDELMRVWRYIERNALSAGLVESADQWEWCSLRDRCHQSRISDPGPFELPVNWLTILNGEEGQTP